MSRISIVVACYYNGMNLPQTYPVIVRDVFEKCPDMDFELIFVDDGSGDD